MTHIDHRLSGRVKPQHIETVKKLLQCVTPDQVSTAIVAHIENKVTKGKSVDGSNGDCLALIVRNGYTVTVMYVRAQQVNAKHLRVTHIIQL